MSADPGNRMRIDRRTTLKWLAATMAAAHAGCSPDEKFLGDEIPKRPGRLLGTAAAPASAGYGTDPNLLDPVVPWPRTMTEAQLEVASALGDMILPADERSPAASSVGVPDFIDEWISAPYPDNVRDKPVILEGLAWIDAESQRRFKKAFATISDAQRAAICDDISSANPKQAFAQPAAFFARYRALTAGGFYTTPVGMKDLRYVGNVALTSFEGPPPEVLKKLGLA